MDLKKTEDGEQMAVMQWAEIAARADARLLNLYHVPNEGKRSKAEAGRLLRMGLKAGVPDLILDTPAGVYHGLRLELKVEPNTPTKAQEEWLQRMHKAGYFVAVAYSAAAAIELINKYLALKPDGEIPQEPGEVWGKTNKAAARVRRVKGPSAGQKARTK